MRLPSGKFGRRLALGQKIILLVLRITPTIIGDWLMDLASAVFMLQVGEGKWFL